MPDKTSIGCANEISRPSVRTYEQVSRCTVLIDSVRRQMYIRGMSLTATEFRKHLFATLERVAAGESVEVVYKGATIRLSAYGTTSKLARAKRQHALRTDPDSITGSDAALLRDMEREWKRDWSEL